LRVAKTETLLEYARIGEFIHEIGIGLLVTHCPGGRLAAWPLFSVAGRGVWLDGTRLPINVTFSMHPEPDRIRQVAECPRVSATFQDGRRYCFLSGLARNARDPASSLVEMQVLTAEYREIVGAEELWGRSLDAGRRA
jgi:hypothetical protein